MSFWRWRQAFDQNFTQLMNNGYIPSAMEHVYWLRGANSKKPRHSSGARSHSTTQGLPNILRNPNVDYRVHKGAPLVPILSQIKSPYHRILSL
jgi:hypothetical protein